MDRKPTVSIVVPVHSMEGASYFLQRNLYSIAAQTYKNYEIVISDDSEDDQLEKYILGLPLPIKYFKNQEDKGMANNTNHGLDRATGDLTKILFLDDYFSHSTSLEEIVRYFSPQAWWLATGCTHTMDGVHYFNNHVPYFSDSENTIGSPSVITLRTEIKIRFDPNFSWVLDLDLYKQLYRKYGKPKIYDQPNVVIGIGLHQMTNILSDYQKAREFQLLKIKYDQATID